LFGYVQDDHTNEEAVGGDVAVTKTELETSSAKLVARRQKGAGWIPDPIEVLRDGNGVYGLGLSDEYLAWAAVNHPNEENCRLILRPDRLSEECGRGQPVLQCLPQRGRLFRRSREARLRNSLFRLMHRSAGIDEGVLRPLNETLYGLIDQRTFFGLIVKATRTFNWLLGQALSSADPAALRVARRFPPSLRWKIYRTAARSSRMMQLAETFPLLALCISEDASCADERAKQDAARALVERGARLREVAAACGLPMGLRRIKPGAVHLLSGPLVTRPELLKHMPESLPKMRDWLRAVMAARDCDGDYVAWVARHDIRPHEIEDLWDWIMACMRQARIAAGQDRAERYDVPIERPFAPSMSLATARELSAEWHDAMLKRGHAETQPFPGPWFPAGPLVNGYEIVPITDSLDLHREGRAMHHCVGGYSNRVIDGRCYIYGVREGDERIATIEIVRDQDDRPRLGQVRGPCNASASKEVDRAIRRWLRSQKSELPPIPTSAADAGRGGEDRT
jgi:hypothetical protein